MNRRAHTYPSKVARLKDQLKKAAAGLQKASDRSYAVSTRAKYAAAVKYYERELAREIERLENPMYRLITTSPVIAAIWQAAAAAVRP